MAVGPVTGGITSSYPINTNHADVLIRSAGIGPTSKRPGYRGATEPSEVRSADQSGRHLKDGAHAEHRPKQTLRLTCRSGKQKARRFPSAEPSRSLGRS
jgi:hypothetical protein